MDDKDALIAAARALAQKRGTRRFSERTFLMSTGIGRRRFRRRFRSWGAFCAAAGLEPIVARPSASDDRIFRALHDAFLAQGGVGTKRAIAKSLKLSIETVYGRTGTWSGTLIAFAEWARTAAPDFPYLAEIERRIAFLKATKRAPPKPRRRPLPETRPGPPWRMVGGRLVGEPFHDGPMLHAPINEAGVMVMFGALARELGFRVESVAPGFPDCTAKRRVGPKQWESVRIEFEYRSRNFAAHKHDPKGADLIVCWEHDWPECPLEVVELKAAVSG